MPATYDSGTNTITITAYTEATPCNFTDIYNADVAGGWGKVTVQGSTQFYFTCKLKIGDGSTTTWFADESKQILFADNIVSTHYQPIIDVTVNATFRLGILLNSTKKTTWKGCTIISLENTYAEAIIKGVTGADILLFGSGFYKPSGTQPLVLDYLSTTSKVYDCILSWGRIYRADADIYNVDIQNGGTASFMPSANIVGVDRLNLTGCCVALMSNAASSPVTFRNVYARNCGLVVSGCTATYASFCRMYNSSAHHIIIDADTDLWNFTWSGSTGRWIRKYSFDLQLVDTTGTGIDSVKVKMWDSSDSIVTNATTNSSGVLATQTLNYGYYQQSTGNAPTLETPHESRVYKYGKLMLSSKSSIEAKTDWAFTMRTDIHITQTTEATVAAYTGITVNHATETITISENHILDEIYDYCQYDIIGSTKQIDQTIHTADGVNFVSEYSFIVNTGITVTATNQKLTIATGESYTLTGTANFTGIIADSTATRVPIVLADVVDGTRYRIEITSSGVMIAEGTQSGSGTISSYYEHTTDIGITVVARKGSAAPRYLPYRTTGTLLAEKFVLTVNQIVDDIAI